MVNNPTTRTSRTDRPGQGLDKTARPSRPAQSLDKRSGQGLHKPRTIGQTRQPTARPQLSWPTASFFVWGTRGRHRVRHQEDTKRTRGGHSVIRGRGQQEDSTRTPRKTRRASAPSGQQEGTRSPDTGFRGAARGCGQCFLSLVTTPHSADRPHCDFDHLRLRPRQWRSGFCGSMWSAEGTIHLRTSTKARTAQRALIQWGVLDLVFLMAGNCTESQA